MKILVLCYEYPPIGGGGGRVAQAVSESLARRGHEVRVLTAALGWRSTRDKIRGVEVFRTRSGRRVPDTCAVHEMGMYLLTSLLPVLGHSMRWKPDVIHVHFALPSGLLAWAARLFTGVPYVLTAHLGDVPGGVPEQTDKLFRWVGPIAAAIWRGASESTAVSSFVQRLAENAYHVPVTRILNGIDLNGARAPSIGLRKDRHLVFLGRFNPQKNPDFLIGAFARIRDLPWRLTMIGDGPLTPKVRELIAVNGLNERIVCSGWLERGAIEDILLDADVLCMPSISEGMPVAAVEALRHGLAIVANNIPGVADVVEPGKNGFLVAVNDLEAYAAALRTLCTEDELLLSMRHASWLKVREFELGAIVHQYELRLTEAAAARRRIPKERVKSTSSLGNIL